MYEFFSISKSIHLNNTDIATILTTNKSTVSFHYQHMTSKVILLQK